MTCMDLQTSSTTMKDDERLRIFVLFVLSATASLNCASNSFNEVPVSQEAPVGTEAVFRCQHSTADFIVWKFNNSFVGATPPAGISRGTTDDEDGNLVDTLTVIAKLEYNGTTIQCVAHLAGVPELSEPPAVLLVQDIGFTEGPYSINVTDGAIAHFQCMHRSFNVGWEVNGTVLSGGHVLPSLSVFKHALAGGHTHHVLTVNTSQDYDTTTFTCVLEGDSSIRSAVAVLRVQGPLDAPSHLSSSRNYTTNTTTITWTPPPSIDLTNVEPDIVYCIEVENITCGERGDVIVSECGITEPIYWSSDIPLNYVYNITVTPMSNVEGALNGTLTYLEEEFPILNETTSVFTSPDGTVNVKITIDISDHHNKPLPSSYGLSLTPVGASGSTLWSNVDLEFIRSDSIVLSVSGLEKQMLLHSTVVAYTCVCNPLTNGSVLSAHYAQHILVSSPAPGEITVTGDFLNSSTTTGLLVIAYTSSSNVRYHLYSRTPEQNFRTVINNLEAGDYHVSVFTVENGLPFGEVATLPQRVKLNVIPMKNTSIEKTLVYMLQSTPTGVCITCTFLESSTATDCVAVVHQRISQLNSSAGLMNIESSHKFTRSGDTASGCIERVNLEDYQVGVIGGKLTDIVSPSNSNSCSTSCTTGIALSLGIVAFLLLVSAVGLYVCIHIFRKAANNINSDEEVTVDMKQCAAYEMTSLPKKKIPMESNPAYEQVRIIHEE